LPKLERNRTRDGQNREDLRAAGWEPLVIWECETRDERTVGKLLKAFLDRTKLKRKQGIA
jgi:DNA mismatch endonuclease (patch repair protein)